MTIRKTCPVCGKLNIVEVSEASYMKWEEGALIQDAFPEKSAAEREVIKTGICPECWDKMFGQKDDNKNDDKSLSNLTDKSLREFISTLKDAKVNDNADNIDVELLSQQEFDKLCDYLEDNEYVYTVNMYNLFKFNVFIATITLKKDAKL